MNDWTPSMGERVLLVKRRFKKWYVILLRRLLGFPAGWVTTKEGVRFYVDDMFIHLETLLAHGFSVVDGKPGVVLVDPEGTCFKVKPFASFDLAHLVQMYFEKPYGSGFVGKVVIDVGASIGDSSIKFVKSGAKLVVAVEPDPERYGLLVYNVRANGLQDRVLTINKALSSQAGTRRFHVSQRHPEVNSLDNPLVASLGIAFDREIDVETITLEDILNNVRADHVFLKMDCEGCEYEVLQQLSARAALAIDEVVLEYHGGTRNLPEIFRERGFSVYQRGGYNGYIHAIKETIQP